MTVIGLCGGTAVSVLAEVLTSHAWQVKNDSKMPSLSKFERIRTDLPPKCRTGKDKEKQKMLTWFAEKGKKQNRSQGRQQKLVSPRYYIPNTIHPSILFERRSAENTKKHTHTHKFLFLFHWHDHEIRGSQHCCFGFGSTDGSIPSIYTNRQNKNKSAVSTVGR